MKYFWSALICLFTLPLMAASYDVDPSGMYGGVPCFSTIQAAVNAAADGDILYIHAGTYQENVTVDKAVSLVGDNPFSTILLPAVSNIGDPTFLGASVGTASDMITVKADNVSISNLTLDGSNPSISGTEAVVNGVTIDARNGIVLAVDAPHNGLQVDNVVVRNIFERGIQPGYPWASITGNVVQNSIVQNVEGNAGSAGIFCFNADALITNNRLNQAGIITNWGNSLVVSANRVKHSVTGIQCSNTGGLQIINNVVDSRIDGSVGILAFQAATDNLISGNTVLNCSYGICVLGTYSNRTITVADNMVDGNTTGVTLTTSIGIYSTTEVSSFAPGSTVNVVISGNNMLRNLATGIQVESSNAQRDRMQGSIVSSFPGSFVNSTTINNVHFNNISGNYIELLKTGALSTVTNIDATGNFFDSHGTTQADGFAIEDKILHKMDDPSLSTTLSDGLVTFISNQLFVTGNQGNTAIQRAIDNALADGWTAQVQSGPDYTAQNLTIDKSVTLDGDGPIAVNALQMNGTGKVATLNKDLSLATTLDLTDGLITTGTNKLTLLNGASVSGGSDASHVNGYVEKVGNTPFVFPVGDAISYRPCAITAPAAASDAFMAQYVAASPRSTLAPGGINAAGSPAMLLVSDKEYWNIQQTSGSSLVAPSLTWKDATTSGSKNADADLVVASHGPAGWDNLAQASATSSSGLTWVQSALPATQYGAFALGSTSTLTPLPVHFTYFKASLNGKEDVLQWGISAQSDVSQFTVWQSNDGLHFHSIADLPASGLAYTFTVPQPMSGANYYRVQAIDDSRNGFFTTTKKLTRDGNEIKVLCNQQTLFSLPLNDLAPDNALLNVASLNGAALAVYPVHNNSTPLTITVQHAGIYLFYVTDPSGNTVSAAKVFVGTK